MDNTILFLKRLSGKTHCQMWDTNWSQNLVQKARKTNWRFFPTSVQLIFERVSGWWKENTWNISPDSIDKLERERERDVLSYLACSSLLESLGYPRILGRKIRSGVLGTPRDIYRSLLRVKNHFPSSIRGQTCHVNKKIVCFYLFYDKRQGPLEDIDSALDDFSF